MNEQPRYALVTGASRGIGRAVALALARDHGLNILVNYARGADKAAETVDLVTALGVRAEALGFDVTDREATRAALEGWMARNPTARIDVVVNNAGITRDNLFVFLSPEEWHAVIDTSLHGFFNTTSVVMQKMVRARYGRVINIVSVSGAKGVAGQTNYSAAKAAVIGATRSLAQEVAKRKITVNAVAPGFITSDMTKDLPVDQLKAMIPMERFGEPEEVAHVVSFLAGPKAAYITGEVIHINGGIHS